MYTELLIMHMHHDYANYTLQTGQKIDDLHSPDRTRTFSGQVLISRHKLGADGLHGAL